MELTGVIQKYDWGKVGYASIAAVLHGKDIDPASPYAELWMGTHPKGDAVIKEYNITLREYLSSHQEYLGSAVQYWKTLGSLPYLLKVLSVRKALSIQCHPDKKTAQILNHKYPKVYKDHNHKPEMAIAFTEFSAMCGFRPEEEIQEYFKVVFELEHVISPNLLVAYQESARVDLLKKILLSLVTRSKEVVESALDQFLKRLEGEDNEMKKRCNYTLVKSLHNQFPGDSGVFLAFFLNHVVLHPGEAMYIPPGLPHAYLSGDCIESMANSDNVVRAGLTPKHKDIETFLDIVVYRSYRPEDLKLMSTRISPFTAHFHPPLPDFGVSRVSVPLGIQWVSPYHESCQIFFVLRGDGIITGEKLAEPQQTTNSKTGYLVGHSCDSFLRQLDNPSTTHDIKLKQGTIVFLPSHKRYIISADRLPLILYFAYVNSDSLRL